MGDFFTHDSNDSFNIEAHRHSFTCKWIVSASNWMKRVLRLVCLVERIAIAYIFQHSKLVCMLWPMHSKRALELEFQFFSMFAIDIFECFICLQWQDGGEHSVDGS